MTEEAHNPQYQVEQFEQSHAALVQQEAQVSADDIFGALKSDAQLTQENIQQSVAEKQGLHFNIGLY